MFPLNTILAWNINIIMNKKYDNNNIIIASRAYFLHRDGAGRVGRGGVSWCGACGPGWVELVRGVRVGVGWGELLTVESMNVRVCSYHRW
jgi:hypothetical protein